MKKSDYQLIALVAAILSAVFLYAGVYAYTYYQFTTEWVRFPYAQYAPSLFICGIMSAVTSALMWRASKAIPTPA